MSSGDRKTAGHLKHWKHYLVANHDQPLMQDFRKSKVISGTGNTISLLKMTSPGILQGFRTLMWLG
jgi:hypothetical protein